MKGDRATITTKDGQTLILVARTSGSDIEVDAKAELDARTGQGFYLIHERRGDKHRTPARTIRVSADSLVAIVQDRVGDDTAGKPRAPRTRKPKADDAEG
jgi:hypothetical protein